MNQKVLQAREALQRSQIGAKAPHLVALWNASFSEAEQRLDVCAQVAYDGSKVYVFPSVSTCPGAGKDLMREFGVLVFMRGRDVARGLWEPKLTRPSAKAVEAFQLKLETGAFKSFREIVDDFKTAADRYTALNLANALIANHVPIADASKIKLKDWGPTSEYASGKRRHKFACVLSAYCPRMMLDCFGETFADLVFNELRGVKETSVAAEFRDLLEDIVELAR